MAISGRMTGDETPRFSSAATVMMETGVTSEPVPAVVGTRQSGRRGPRALPTPQASSSASVEPHSSAASLATSSEEPPPKPTIPVAPHARPAATARSSVARDGSASTASNIVSESPAVSSEEIAASPSPSRRSPGSVTSSSERPSRLSRMASSRRAAPDSTTIDGVVLKTNGVIALGSEPLDHSGFATNSRQLLVRATPAEQL